MKKQKRFKNRQFLCDSGVMLEKDRSLIAFRLKHLLSETESSETFICLKLSKYPNDTKRRARLDIVRCTKVSVSDTVWNFRYLKLNRLKHYRIVWNIFVLHHFVVNKFVLHMFVLNIGLAETLVVRCYYEINTSP
jgi:hypothetical protein